MLKSILSGFSDFFWPRECAVCERPVDRPGRYLCSDCLNRLDFMPVTGLCRRCGRDVPGLAGDFVCDDCKKRTHPHFDRAVSALRFFGEARQLVNRFKFKNAFYLCNDFVDILEATARTAFIIDGIDLVLPMPSTLQHRIFRGYNQCELLASRLAHRLGVKYSSRVLRRVGSPKKQGGLDEEERLINVKGTFAVRDTKAIAGKTILVLDDIMTTGSTLSECSSALKSSGAKRISAISLARSSYI